MNNLVVGILAHVDAGKTTLSESILYLCGNIRKLGRVDHGDAFLDTFELEKSRGITIFAKQAVFELGETKFTLLDTPGHVDFSAEMERTLQVLDYAILVINGADGVQGHTRTLWNLLKRYKIPTFLFINKMDQNGTDRDRLIENVKSRLNEACVPFDIQDDEFFENAAMCDETALEEYLETSELCEDTLVRMIAQRKIFPCYFGSALKVQGVQEFLDGLEVYTKQKKVDRSADEFGAKVYKISRDNQGNRLTHLKVTSGVLKTKDILKGTQGSESWEEKVNQIRIYSGGKFEPAQEVRPGMICAVTGLSYTSPGEGLGIENASESPMLEPVLNYQIQLPEGCDVHTMLRNLRQLEEEDPMLRIVWNEELGEIHAQLMGEVQIEILKSLIKDRFDTEVTFGTGNIVYKETIGTTVEGVGHYEPLRHYSEVHLLMEPGVRGSGLIFDTDCSEDVLDKNWQRLIMTHLLEKTHLGVLTGSAITDMKITLVAGKAHLKHTEGGDFRQSTYRAVRQGLMQAESILLEPYYDFRLEVPAEMVGRALNDIQRMSGEFEGPETDGEMAVLTGSAPVSTMRDYQMEVTSYSKGRGRLSCTFKGYDICHNAEEIIEACGYDPEADLDNPPGSIFCAHGAGFNVRWNKVYEYMHIESQLKKRQALERAREEELRKQRQRQAKPVAPVKKNVVTSYDAKADEELEEIFIRTYGKVEKRTDSRKRTVYAATPAKKKKEEIPEFLLVDGYNVIYAWEDLKDLSKVNFDAARDKLMDILCNYQGYKKCTVILVFDAYKLGGTAKIMKYHNINVVYTNEAETADQYIEKVVHNIGKKYNVTVVTSDGVERVVTLGQGGRIISSQDFEEEVEFVNQQIREEYESRRILKGKNYLFDHMDEELAKEMEDVRMGRKEIK